MKNTFNVNFVVTWKSPRVGNRKESWFSDLARAVELYEEKDAEGKNPKLYEREESVTYREVG